MTEPTLVDIGVNLTHRRFRDDLAEVLERASSAGVAHIVVTGTSVRESAEAQKLASRFPMLTSTAGVHPHDAKSCDETTIATLRALAEHDEVVAIGECGLDFDRDFSPRDVQETWFANQLALASEVALPVFLHERAAHERFLAIMKEHRAKLSAGVVHCFTGNERELRAYLDLDLHIGVTGWLCDERRGQGLREVVKYVPADRLMIETDAPFLTPRDLRPKPKKGRNEPALLPHILKHVAVCVGRDEETVAHETTQTARAFFKLG